MGHYERFIDEDLNQIFQFNDREGLLNVLNKERNGEYLGETIQVIPHITNEIKSFVYSVGQKTNADVVITEIGGTAGDIESQPFLEAIRQIGLEVGQENCLFIHVTLVPLSQEFWRAEIQTDAAFRPRITIDGNFPENYCFALR